MTDTETLNRYLAGGLTVGALKAHLAGLPDGAPVVFAYQYGDHARTVVAQRARDADEGRVVWSDYHGLPREVDDDEWYDDDGNLKDSLADGAAEVVVIS